MKTEIIVFILLVGITVINPIGDDIRDNGNKSGEWCRFSDEQYYLDISVTPLK